MKVKVHWIIDGVAELEMDSLEAGEAHVDEVLRKVISDNPVLVEELGARALQGKAYLPGSEDDVDVEGD
ncbi:MAG: translation initiation factor IF-2 [Pseudomonadota bacterium]|nr:translation initiation factor IF-2 [Pseudomonadota bacterium]MEC8673891.1 translation initiation factor IF-2 [Pseudomonadota bacterium]|tara:strand:- start:54 stop:260 length:207 start_codon:yes stop_codon:yes gene_type:complete